MDEIWKTINNYIDYQVSNKGRIKILANKATRKERILKPLIQQKGYFRVALYKNNKSKFFLIHRLVAESFIENKENKETVNHKDGNKANNCIENLEWCSYRENINHAIDNKLSSCGERSGNRKLNYNQVSEIRISNLKIKELALLYNVTRSTISRIKNNKGWNL